MTNSNHDIWCKNLLNVIKSCRASIRILENPYKDYYKGELKGILLSLRLYKITSGEKIFSKPRF